MIFDCNTHHPSPNLWTTKLHEANLSASDQRRTLHLGNLKLYGILTAYCELQHMQVADMCAHENPSRLAGFTISLLKMSRISSPFLALQGRQPSTNLSTVLLDRTTTKGWHLHLNSRHASQSCQSWGTVPHLSRLDVSNPRDIPSARHQNWPPARRDQLFQSQYVILF